MITKKTKICIVDYGFGNIASIENALGYSFEGFERTIDAHIRNLRKKLEPDPKNPTYITTVFGVGYRLQDPEVI